MTVMEASIRRRRGEEWRLAALLRVLDRLLVPESSLRLEKN